MRSLIFISALFIAGCASKPDIQTIPLTDVANAEAHINPRENALSVIYFLSPECPLCINYTLAMRNLEQDFASDSIVFYGIYSKEWFTPAEVDSFALKYDLGFKMLFDDGNRLAHALNATVTPEVVVLNRDGDKIYSGKIDNWVNDLGKKKLEVTDHYLENALVAWRDGEPIEPKRTEPKGCLIE
ncbi:MAG: redoxin domain-containing protein [Flavobacteriales bacterium]|nr:redoxin domain-containing protein [Flavobacteriales bacterium]